MVMEIRLLTSMSLNWKKSKQQSQISKNGHKELPKGPKPQFKLKKRKYSKGISSLINKPSGLKPTKIILRKIPQN